MKISPLSSSAQSLFRRRMQNKSEILWSVLGPSPQQFTHTHTHWNEHADDASHTCIHIDIQWYILLRGEWDASKTTEIGYIRRSSAIRVSQISTAAVPPPFYSFRSDFPVSTGWSVLRGGLEGKKGGGEGGEERALRMVRKETKTNEVWSV